MKKEGITYTPPLVEILILNVEAALCASNFENSTNETVDTQYARPWDDLG